MNYLKIIRANSACLHLAKALPPTPRISARYLATGSNQQYDYGHGSGSSFGWLKYGAFGLALLASGSLGHSLLRDKELPPQFEPIIFLAHCHEKEEEAEEKKEGGEEKGEGAAPPPEKPKESCEIDTDCIHKLDKIEEIIAKSNADLEKMLKDVKQPAIEATEEALKAYCKAQQDLKLYMDRAYCAITDDNLESPGFEDVWCTLEEFSAKRDEAVKEAEGKGEAAWDLLCKLKQLIANGKSCKYTDCNPLLKTAKESLNCAEYELANAKKRTDCMIHEGELVDKYAKLVGDFRKGLKAEMDSLIPEGGCRGEFSCNECNMLLTHAYKKILRVQREFSEVEKGASHHHGGGGGHSEHGHGDSGETCPPTPLESGGGHHH